jgi:thioredoxin 1
MLEDFAELYSGKVKVCKLNVDKSKKPNEYTIRGVPAFLTFKAGQPKSELIGLVPKDQLVDLVDELLK